MLVASPLVCHDRTRGLVPMQVLDYEGEVHRVWRGKRWLL
jgi:hypothetical protein